MNTPGTSRPGTGPPGTSPLHGERVAKVIARAGLCSRREAEKMIAAGRVAVDGRAPDSPAVTVGPDNLVTVDGKPLPALEAPRLWRYHKPPGLLTTLRDPQGRPTVFDRLPAELPRVMPVGRLDLTSEGLLLLTNDGGLKRKLELPSTGWTRRYRVRVYGRVEQDSLDRLAAGITVDGVSYGPIVARIDSGRGESGRIDSGSSANAWLTVSLSEGKNREVRRACEHLGLKVNRLIRVAYGPYQLGKLPRGGVEEVSARIIAEQFGERPPGRKVGTAKAKPPPRKPGWRKRKAASHERRAASGAPSEQTGTGSHANRRRPA